MTSSTGLAVAFCFGFGAIDSHSFGLRHAEHGPRGAIRADPIRKAASEMLHCNMGSYEALPHERQVNVVHCNIKNRLSPLTR